MAEKPEDLNLPTAVITRMIKEVVRSLDGMLFLAPDYSVCSIYRVFVETVERTEFIRVLGSKYNYFLQFGTDFNK